MSYSTPPAAEPMRRVTDAEFYAVIGPMNVHPSPQGRYDGATGYITEWRQQGSRALAGISDGGTLLCPSRYWLPKRGDA